MADRGDKGEFVALLRGANRPFMFLTSRERRPKAPDETKPGRVYPRREG